MGLTDWRQRSENITDYRQKAKKTTDYRHGPTLSSIYISVCFVKKWPLGLSPGAGRSPVSKKVGGLTSWSVQLDSPATALTVGGWIRPWGQN